MMVGWDGEGLINSQKVNNECFSENRQALNANTTTNTAACGERTAQQRYAMLHIVASTTCSYRLSAVVVVAVTAARRELHGALHDAVLHSATLTILSNLQFRFPAIANARCER